MSIYSRIYYTLCSSKSQLSEHWKTGSGLHRHHIIPKHSGGTDDPGNFTYLTVREHIIAHFLLWKMHRNPDDLRAMKMLGANLSVEYRREIGIFCRVNKIGFFGASPDLRKKWQEKGLKSQENIENSWVYWSTKEGRKRRASMGGKVGGKKQAEFKLGFHQPHIQLKAASLGGKSHAGKRCMYKPGDTTFKRVKPEDIQFFLQEGYVFGSPIPAKNQYSS